MQLISRTTTGLAIAATLLASFSASAADKPSKSANSAALQKLAACREIGGDTERLACFDREVAALDTAVKERRVAVIDQEDVRKTRRKLFGIPLPSIKLFDDKVDEPEVKEITATIRSTTRDEGGRIVFTLEDGAVWAQTDEYPVFSNVKPGQKVVIKRASFGSYFAKFEKTVSVRAKRLR